VALLVNGAYALFLFSYLVRDILKLRLLSLVAGFLLVAFFLATTPPNLAAVAWNVVFSIINVVQIYILLLERRPVRLSAEEQELHQMVFRSLSPREFKKLCELSTFKEAKPDERIVEPGRALDSLMVIVSGEVHVRAKDGHVASLREGQFVGEMSYLTGKAPAVEVVAARATRYAAIGSDRLKRLLDGSGDLRAAVQSILGVDLVHKLRT
jgi:hypothetical protein